MKRFALSTLAALAAVVASEQQAKAWFNFGVGSSTSANISWGGRHSGHFALRVKDARLAREHFRAAGVSIAETTLIPHCDRFFVNDPDFNRIELHLDATDRLPSGDGRVASILLRSIELEPTP